MAYNTTTNKKNLQMKDGKLISYKLKGSQIINKGDIVIVKASDGLAYKAFAAASAAAGDLFVGIASESVTSGALDASDEVCVWATGEFTMTAAGLSIADTGATVWHDAGGSGSAQTVTKSTGDATHAPKIGVITRFITATEAIVRIDGCASAFAGVAL